MAAPFAFLLGFYLALIVMFLILSIGNNPYKTYAKLAIELEGQRDETRYWKNEAEYNKIRVKENDRKSNRP